MNTVDLLIEGYAKVIKSGPGSPQGGWKASGTTCLIRNDSGVLILTDPGANRALLLEQLAKLDVQIDDIEYIFLTHLHLDHSLLMGIFSGAKVINHEAITSGENGELISEMIPGTDITIIKTPGHEYAGASLLVPTKEGTVGIVGDVFWFSTSAEASADKEENSPEQLIDINAPDDFAENMDVLKESRQKVLDLCDFIVPGHGKMFAVSK